MIESTRYQWGRRGVVICALAWLALAIGFGALVGSQNLLRYYALAVEGAKTQGIVSAVEQQNHRSVDYSYQVDGVTHAGRGNVGAGNPSFDSLHVGDSVLLYYLPREPGYSSLGEPQPRLQNEIISVVAVMLLFPPFIIWRLVTKGVLPRR